MAVNTSATPTTPQLRLRGQLGMRASLRQIWAFRDLVLNLVIRDLKVRYKYSVLGILWSLLNPLFMMLIFALVFTLFLKQEIVHFPVFFLSGQLPWNFLQASVMGATATIVGNGGLIKKVYFPREVLPLAFVLSNLVHFGLALLVLGGFIIATGIGFTQHLVWLPLIIFLHFMFVMGLGFFTSAVNVFYRDTMMIMDVALQAWFFLTPIFYSMDIIPASASFMGWDIPVQRLVRWLNPMASIIDLYRNVLYGDPQNAIPGPPAISFLLRTGVTAFVVFFVGWWVFRRVSPRFGEEV